MCAGVHATDYCSKSLSDEKLDRSVSDDSDDQSVTDSSPSWLVSSTADERRGEQVVRQLHTVPRCYDTVPSLAGGTGV